MQVEMTDININILTVNIFLIDMSVSVEQTQSYSLCNLFMFKLYLFQIQTDVLDVGLFKKNTYNFTELYLIRGKKSFFKNI